MATQKKIARPLKKELEVELNDLTLQEIADKHSVSKTTAWRWAKDYGLKAVRKQDIHMPDMPEKAKVPQKTGTAVNTFRNIPKGKIIPRVTMRKSAAKKVVSQSKEAGDIRTKPLDKEKHPVEAPYQKNIRDFRNILDNSFLGDISIVGFVICPKESRVPEDSTTDDLADIAEKTIQEEYSDVLDGNSTDNLYRISDTVFYLLLHFDKKRSDSKKCKNIKWKLWNDSGIFAAFCYKRGTYFTNPDDLLDKIDETLNFLSKNAVYHIGVINDDTPQVEGNIAVDDVPEQKNTPLTSPININIDAEAVANLPEDIEEPDSETVEELLDYNKEDIVDIASADKFNSMLARNKEKIKQASDKEAEEMMSRVGADPIKEVHFIDSENVSSQWKNILSDDPAVITEILYTDHTPKITYDTMAEILKHPNGIKLEKVTSGEKDGQALDFQLVSLLGYMINEYPERKFVIVSLDKGYDPVIEFWNKKGYNVSRMPMINRDLPAGETAFVTLSDEEKAQIKAGCTNEVEKAFHTPSAMEVKKKIDPRAGESGKKFDRIVFLQKIIPKRDKEIYESIMNILEDKEADDLRHIHADFVQIFGGREGEMLYKKIKKNIKEYKEI